MKTLMNVLMFSVIIVALCGITDAENIVTDGLMSYWTFDREDIIDNTVKDVWGENNATIVGTPTIVNGHLKDALKFDGVKDYVNLTTLGDFGAKLDFYTVEMWIKTDYKETWTTIFKTIDTCNSRNSRTTMMIWGIDINRRTINAEERQNDPFGPQIIFAEDFIQLYLASFFKNRSGVFTCLS